MGTRSAEHTHTLRSQSAYVCFFIFLFFNFHSGLCFKRRPFFKLKQTRASPCTEQSK